MNLNSLFVGTVATLLLTRALSAASFELMPDGFFAFDVSADGQVVAGRQLYLNIEGIGVHAPATWSPGDTATTIIDSAFGPYGLNRSDDPIADVDISDNGQRLTLVIDRSYGSNRNHANTSYAFILQSGQWNEAYRQYPYVFTDVSDVGFVVAYGEELLYGDNQRGYQPGYLLQGSRRDVPYPDPLPDTADRGLTVAVTPDGQYLAGYDSYYIDDRGGIQGFRFHRETSELERFPFRVLDMSADGQTLVGYTGSFGPGQRRQIGYWTEATGFQSVLSNRDPLRPTNFMLASDGNVFLIDFDQRLTGNQLTNTLVAPIGGETLPLDELLELNGFDLNGWTLVSASAVSHDGKVIVGTGRFQDQPVSWRAELSSVPEPHAALLGILGIICLLCHQSRPGRSR